MASENRKTKVETPLPTKISGNENFCVEYKPTAEPTTKGTIIDFFLLNSSLSDATAERKPAVDASKIVLNQFESTLVLIASLNSSSSKIFSGIFFKINFQVKCLG